VDLNALRENLAWIRHRVGPGVRILTVVKADAYGHGLKQIAALLMQSGTDVFGVANLAEARAIRGVGHGWPILMLGACLPDERAEAIRDDVMATVSSFEEAGEFSAAAVKLGRTAQLHVKVDTGMGRLGIEPEHATALIARIESLPGLELKGLYTHFSSAEDDASFTARQGRRFQEVLRGLDRPPDDWEFLHANNSAAVLLEKGTFFNTIRPGLLVYGVLPPGRRRVKSRLKDVVTPALTWKCRVSLVKSIARGTPLSYGHMFKAPRQMRVATITAGYGDGYLRSGSGRVRVLIGGRRCPVVGRITMDQMIADVSRVPTVKPGDEVVLIGSQDGDRITASELAGWAETIPWEVLTAITYRVPRVYRGVQAS
jgi:alanine racemase